MSDPGETDGGDPTAGISETKGEPESTASETSDKMGIPVPNTLIPKLKESDLGAVVLLLRSASSSAEDGSFLQFNILKSRGRKVLSTISDTYIEIVQKTVDFLKEHPDVVYEGDFDLDDLENHLKDIMDRRSMVRADAGARSSAGGPLPPDDDLRKSDGFSVEEKEEATAVDSDIAQLMQMINDTIRKSDGFSEPGEEGLEAISDVLDDRLAQLTEQVEKITKSSIFKINPEALARALVSEAKKALQPKPPTNPTTDLAFGSTSKLGRETSRTLQELSKCKYPFKRVIHASALEKALTNHDYCRFREWMAKNHPEFQRIHSEEDVLPEEFSNMSASAIRSLMNAYIKIFGSRIGVNRRKCTAKSSLRDCAFEYGEIRELAFMFLSNIPPPSAVIELPKPVEKKIEPIAVKSSDFTKVQPVKSTDFTTAGSTSRNTTDIMQRLRLLMSENAILGHASNSSFARTGLEARVVGQPSTQANAPVRKHFGKPVRKIAF